jgi:hypothetical protein
MWVYILVCRELPGLAAWRLPVVEHVGKPGHRCMPRRLVPPHRQRAVLHPEFQNQPFQRCSGTSYSSSPSCARLTQQSLAAGTIQRPSTILARPPSKINRRASLEARSREQQISGAIRMVVIGKLDCVEKGLVSIEAQSFLL